MGHTTESGEMRYLKLVIDLLEKESVDTSARLATAEKRVEELLDERRRIQEERKRLLMDLAQRENMPTIIYCT